MEIREETKWLCENARALERFSGKWVLFSVPEGIVEKGESLIRLLRSAQKARAARRPFVFHVPSKKDLSAPVASPKRR